MGRARKTQQKARIPPDEAPTLWREMCEWSEDRPWVLSWLAWFVICAAVWRMGVNPSYGEWQLRQWASTIILVSTTLLDFATVALIVLWGRWRREAFIALLVREGVLPPTPPLT